MRHQHLWEVRTDKFAGHFWILAGPTIESARKKAEKFLVRFARANNAGRHKILGIEFRGTIDVF